MHTEVHKKKEDLYQMSYGDFVWNTILSSVWAGFVYSRTLFKTYQMKSYFASMMILIGVVLAVTLVGSAISWKRNRSSVVIARNIAIGLLLYTMLTYPWNGIFLILVCLMALLIVVYMLLTFRIWKKKNGKILENLRMRRYRQQFFSGTNFIMAAAPVMILCVIFVVQLIHKIPTGSNVRAYAASDFEQMVEEKLPVLEELAGFSTMSIQQKVDMGQELVNLECTYLGLGSRPLTVKAKDIDGVDGYIAYYDLRKHDISLDISDLELSSGYDFVASICHEVFHSYQEATVQAYQAVDDPDLKNLKLYEDARVYAEEFESYQEGDDEESFEAYYSQRCEEACRNYGESRADYYLRKVGLIGQDSTSHVKYVSNKAYLVSGDGEVVAGPYLFLESHNWSGNGIRRFVDDSGEKIGYVDSYGRILAENYLTGSIMEYGTALVSENEGEVFFIDDKGNSITRKYVQAFPFEYNGCYARVKTSDGKWNLINRQDEILYTADWIDQLPGSFLYKMASAKIDGHVVLLKLTGENDHWTCSVAKELGFETATVYWDDFIIVRDGDGNYGVLDIEGKEIIAVKYKSIVYDKLRGDEINPTMVQFQLGSEDGSIDYVQRCFYTEGS